MLPENQTPAESSTPDVSYKISLVFEGTTPTLSQAQNVMNGTGLNCTNVLGSVVMWKINTKANKTQVEQILDNSIEKHGDYNGDDGKFTSFNWD